MADASTTSAVVTTERFDANEKSSANISREGSDSLVPNNEPAERISLKSQTPDSANVEPVALVADKPDEAYSVFTRNQKKAIILTASLAAFFSPLTSQIYFPALNTLAADLHVTYTLINLTVTTYMVWFNSPARLRQNN